MKRKSVLTLITMMVVLASSQNVLAGKEVSLDSFSKLKVETTEAYEAEETLPDISTNEDAVIAENIVEENQPAPVEEAMQLMDIDANTMIADVNGEEYVFYVTNAFISRGHIYVHFEANNPRGEKQYRIEIEFPQDAKPGTEFSDYFRGMTFQSQYYDGRWHRTQSLESTQLYISYRDDKWEHYQGAFSSEFEYGDLVENAVFDFRLNDEYGTAENSEDSDSAKASLQDLIKNFQ